MTLIRVAAAALALAAFAAAVPAAELPTQARRAKPPENGAAQRKCNIGGMVGVLAANGVCVKLSGSISAGFGGSPIR